jgi:transglutaminase-like putative cysteine protease
MRYRVRHETEYLYSVPVTDGYTVAHLLPRDSVHQRVLSSSLDISPQPSEYEETVDAFGNRVVHFAVHRSHDALGVVADLEVEVDPPVVDGPGPSWIDVARRVEAARDDLAVDVGMFTAPEPDVPVEGIAQLTRATFLDDQPIIPAVRELCAAIHRDFVFDPSSTDVFTPLAQVFAARRGVCQDFAHVAVAALRSLGLAARYVSGYIETVSPPGEPKLVGVDASHAWASLWVPGNGWIDFDPTNDQLPPSHHVTMAWGRDYRDVAPVRGVVIGPPSTQNLSVKVDVARQT